MLSLEKVIFLEHLHGFTMPVNAETNPMSGLRDTIQFYNLHLSGVRERRRFQKPRLFWVIKQEDEEMNDRLQVYYFNVLQSASKYTLR